MVDMLSIVSFLLAWDVVNAICLLCVKDTGEGARDQAVPAVSARAAATVPDVILILIFVYICLELLVIPFY